MIQACMVGIIFSKLARPKKRASTLMFSRNAVVCQRDGTNCLLFRFWNSHSMLKLFLTWSQGGQHETHITSGGSCASHPYKVVISDCDEFDNLDKFDYLDCLIILKSLITKFGNLNNWAKMLSASGWLPRERCCLIIKKNLTWAGLVWSPCFPLPQVWMGFDFSREKHFFVS